MHLFNFSALFLACLLLTAGCNKGDTIRIGANAELTGSVPVVGKSCINAAKMAVEEINGIGGIAIGGKPFRVELMVEDNEDKAEAAAAVTQKLVSSGCVAMVGPNASRNAIPAATIAEASRLLMISPWSTNPKLTENKRFVYRACFTDDFQGVVVAAFVYGKLHLKRAAVLFDVASEYNKGIAEVFKKEYSRLGGEVVALESYSTGDKDFTAQLSKIKASAPEALFLPNYYNEVPLQIQQARQQGYTGAVVGSDSWGSQEILALGRDFLEGLYFTTHYAPDMATEKAKTFIVNYERKYGSKPDDVAALTYDSYGMLFESIKKAGSKDPEKIREQLAGLSQYEGVTGTMQFTPGSGSPRKSAVVIQIKNNKFIYFDSVSPL